MSSLGLALITDVPLSKEAVLSMLGEKNPLSVVKGLGVAVSAVGKVICTKTATEYRRMDKYFGETILHNLMAWPAKHLLPPSLLMYHYAGGHDAV